MNSIEKSEKTLKRLIEKLLKTGRYEDALEVITVVARLLHLKNDRFIDEQLECFMENIGDSVLSEITIDSNKQNLLFYDSVFSDQTVLSRQYLQALIDMNIPFVYMVQPHIMIEESTMLIDMAQSCENCTLVYIDIQKSNLKKIAFVRNYIIEHNINTVLIQSRVSDVVPNLSFSNVKGMKTFFINHADDQFWLGNQSFDTYINFSESVQSISVNGRKIPKDKNVINKFYPFIQKEKFQGFNFEIAINNPVFIFSGGRYEKIKDSSDTFLKIVQRILETYESVIFIFSGSGDSSYMQKYVDKLPNISDRWIILKYRKDLFEFMKRMDIYLSTYPIKGGLMSMYAAYAGLPIVEKAEIGEFRSEELFNTDFKGVVSFLNWADYNNQINKLVEDKQYREQEAEQMKAGLITREDFCEKLKQILLGKSDIYNEPSSIEEVDLDHVIKTNISTFDSSNNKINKTLVNNVIRRYKFTLYLKSLIMFLMKMDKSEKKEYLKKGCVWLKHCFSGVVYED